MENSNEYSILSESQKELFKLQLQRDKSKDFDSEFIRTTDLENEIVKTYGFDGIRFLYENTNSTQFVALGEFPQDCPWQHVNDKSPADFIDSNFGLLAGDIPTVIKEMKERCLFIYAEKTDSSWQLHYLLDMKLYDGRDYHKIYTGGAPEPHPNAGEHLTSFGWTIPEDLARFYAVHDGFGDSDANHVASSSELRVMGEMMNPICRKKGFDLPAEYKFDDLLEFCPDGAGNAQCFLRKDADGAQALTVDWDHEIWEISDEMSFYEFIDERLSRLDEE